MKTALKNVIALVVMAAMATYLILIFVHLPVNGLVAVTSGQALTVFVGYLIIFLNNNSSTLARTGAKLRRLESNDVKRFFALLFMWALMLAALVYSVINHFKI